MPVCTVLFAAPDRQLVLSHYAPGEDCGGHRHEETQRSRLLAGSYVEHSEAGRREVEGPMLSIKPPGFEHEDRFGEAGALILSIRGKPCPGGDHGYRLAPWSAPCTLQMAIDETASLVGGQVGTPATEAEPWRDPALAPPWLREARQRLIDQPELPVASLARSFGRHPVHLARQFRSAFGRAPSQVRQNDRTARAIDQIVRSSRPLADIACAAGFADQAHMTRVLNEATGWTPGGLRRVLAR